MQPNDLVSVSVQDLEFHLPKGMYNDELLLENKFKVSAIAKYQKNIIPEDSYINYETIVEILNSEMNTNNKLLETIVQNCLEKIYGEWPFISFCKVTIKKLNPAFEGYKVGEVVVEMER